MKLDRAVGQRIAKAREYLGLTQALVAQRMELARTTQVAIEQGQRPVSVSELQRYGQILGRPLEYFFGDGVWQEDAGFRACFRQLAERLDAARGGPPRRPGRPRGVAEPSAEKLALVEFESLCRHALELERVNGLASRAMPEIALPARLSAAEGEQLAAVVRAHLGVGDEVPLRDLRALLEETWGVRVFVRRNAGRVQAAAFRHPRAGGCVLVAAAPAARLRLSVARALGHLLAGRDEALLALEGQTRRSPLDAFAQAFGAALLLPARALRERFAAAQAELGEPGEAARVYLARAYGVDLDTLCARLQSLRLRPSSKPQPGAAQRTDPEAIAPAVAEEPAWERLPERYLFLAVRAWRRKLIDDAHLAECLGVSAEQAPVRAAAYLSSANLA